jgi:hypothetical protein
MLNFRSSGIPAIFPNLDTRELKFAPQFCVLQKTKILTEISITFNQANELKGPHGSRFRNPRFGRSPPIPDVSSANLKLSFRFRPEASSDELLVVRPQLNRSLWNV